MYMLKYCDINDLRIIKQVMEVYKVKMFNNGMYIPKQIQRALNHFDLDMSEIGKDLT